MRSARVAAVLLFLAATVLGLGWAAAVRAQGQPGPIKLGLLVPQTGPLAANGKDMVNALQLFLEQRGNRLAGREVNPVIEDDAGVPATGLTKTRGLVESQHIHVMIGPEGTSSRSSGRRSGRPTTARTSPSSAATWTPSTPSSPAPTRSAS